jgi:hypothetical protein
LTFLNDDASAAATLAACLTAFCCSIKDNTFCLASALLLHEAPWMELLVVQCKMVADAVGMSAVPRSSGVGFKSPNVLFSVFEAALFSLFEVATAVLPVGYNGWDCVVAAFYDDQVKCDNGDAASLVLGTLTNSGVGAASFEANFPCCACAAEEAACLALH